MLKENIYIKKFSILAPGMEKIDEYMPVLRGESSYRYQALSNVKNNILSNAEARRVTPIIQLALRVAEPLLTQNDISLVFASSNGDLVTTDKMCQALTKDNKLLSPTQFHNSVHNAPAGYLSIAKSINQSSVSISAGNETFAASLLESVTKLLTDQNDILLIAYDYPAPKPLSLICSFGFPLAIGLHLSLKQENIDESYFNLSLTNGCSVSCCDNTSLNQLCDGNPIGIGIVMMEMLAQTKNKQIYLPYINNNQLLVEFHAKS